MHRRLSPILIALAFAASVFADDVISKPRWSIHAECQTIVLPQKLALPLSAEMNDEAKMEAAWVLLGVFRVSEPEKHMEFFILKAEAKNVG